VKSIIGGPIAKAFNANTASLYEQIHEQRVPPSNLFASEDETREVAERLSRDVGYDPVYIGGLERARALEDHTAHVLSSLLEWFYRYAKTGRAVTPSHRLGPARKGTTLSPARPDRIRPRRR
jgi:8-hydroxy-5-deazaflavin:NADPH oxidoreductase